MKFVPPPPPGTKASSGISPNLQDIHSVPRCGMQIDSVSSFVQYRVQLVVVIVVIEHRYRGKRSSVLPCFFPSVIRCHLFLPRLEQAKLPFESREGPGTRNA